MSENGRKDSTAAKSGRFVGAPGKGAACGLAAALLFGVSVPLAKVLLASVPALLLAGLLYLGAAIALWLWRVAGPASGEVPLARADLLPLGAMIAAGGIAAPVAMLAGLARVTAASGSLLLNLEAPLTVLLALWLFGERLGVSARIGVCCVFAGALVLAIDAGPLGGDALGCALLAGACLLWAIDNNLTQRLASRDPFAIARAKATVAGLVNTALGLAAVGGDLPPSGLVAVALAAGSVAYGASVVLDTYALRFVGAAREAAYFSTAPFFGALVSVLVLGDRPGWREPVAALAMAAGVVSLLRERRGA